MLLNTGFLGNGLDSSRLLELFNERFWFRIDGVFERGEGVFRSIVEEPTFLEEKGDILLATNLSCISYIPLHSPSSTHTIPLDLAEIRRARVGYWD